VTSGEFLQDRRPEKWCTFVANQVCPDCYPKDAIFGFGATDKYDVVSFEGFPAEAVTERDVMRLGYRRLKQLRIDPLTAAEIGWPTDEE
jgi:hypothetical protein